VVSERRIAKTTEAEIVLVLRRKINQRILLSNGVEIVLVRVDSPMAARIGIEAPSDVTILREEVPDRREWESGG